MAISPTCEKELSNAGSLGAEELLWFGAPVQSFLLTSHCSLRVDFSPALSLCRRAFITLSLSVDLQESLSMAGKPKLYYFNGRGRMESIRWLLAAAGVEVRFIFILGSLSTYLGSWCRKYDYTSLEQKTNFATCSLDAGL